MTKLIFIRHGEPDYSKVSERKYIKGNKYEINRNRTIYIRAI